MIPPITPPAIAPALEWLEDSATAVEPAADDDDDGLETGVEDVANCLMQSVLEPLPTKNSDEEV